MNDCLISIAKAAYTYYVVECVCAEADEAYWRNRITWLYACPMK